MKITDVKAIALAVPLKPVDPPSTWASWAGKSVLVRVYTDEGLVGIGESFSFGAPLAICNVVDEELSPLLVDQDPGRIEHLADRMQRTLVNVGRRGLGMFAIGAVEMALWDLLGKATELPLHALLGGALRSRLPVYASLPRYESPEQVAQACRTTAAAGFESIKLHQVDVASVAAAREAVGDGVDLMLDMNCPLSPAQALAMARELEPFRLAWLEEPIWPPEDYDALAELRRASSMPIATGENESTAFGFRELIAKGAADVIQPDVPKVGGIGEFRRIAALAGAANVAVTPHSYFYGPALAASLHMAATLPGALPAELATGELETPLLTTPLRARDGFVDVPDGPGLGVEVNEEALERHPYADAGAQPFLLH